MTAEIALINRRALTFAADSAVTISDGTNDKIYNSAEKIFEVCRKVPVGLMLYNNMEFMGIPLDVISRNFRRDCDAKYKTIRAVADKFLDYLASCPRADEDEFEHFGSIIRSELEDILLESKSGFQKFFLEKISEGDSDVALKIEDLSQEYLISIINKHKDIHDGSRLVGFCDAIDISSFWERYGDSVTAITKATLRGRAGNDAVMECVRDLSYSIMKSSIFSDSLTGLVFGGFGEDDIFPTVFYLEIDGIYFGQIKVNACREIDIDRRGTRAEIVPFAQREVVERFLSGIDEDLQNKTLSYIKKTIEKIFQKISADVGVELTDAGFSSDEYCRDIDRFMNRIKERSRLETLDMVDFMPKQELAYAAEALVSLTSMKRRVSAQQETVGGPVDVAVITKNEGFVWIRRKHYFSVELNPAYKSRAFGADLGDG